MDSTTSCEGGPNRSSTFCPGGGVKVTTSDTDAATGVTGRCVVCANPSTATRPASGTRVRRCAVDSTTTSSGSSSSPTSRYADDGSDRPCAIVDTWPVAGS